MDQTVIEKILIQAEKDRDLTAVVNALRNANSRDVKIAILSGLFGFEQILPIKFTPSEDFHNDDKFRTNLVRMLFPLSSEDHDISIFFEENFRKIFQVVCRDEKMGAGVEGRWLDHYFCSNGESDGKKCCTNQGNLRCSECGLAAYCSKSCQKEHWKRHKRICRDNFLKSDRWIGPLWVLEKRDPSFLDNRCDQGKPKLDIRIWGNTPAFDLIGFKLNEHEHNAIWQKPMNIAFVASGDFRSVVETLASIPDDYQEPITIVLNDENPIIVARNLFMLNLLLHGGETALDMVIAIWYSASMTEIQDLSICLCYFPFRFGNPKELKHGLSSIELNQLDDVLKTLSSMVQFRKDLSNVATAIHNKDTITYNALLHNDDLHRTLLGLQDYHRMPFVEFLHTGVLQPSDQQSLYSVKSATNRFLLVPESKWLIDDTCDPKQGWSMLKVIEFGDEKRLPKNDLYGRLFFYIRDQLRKMVSTMQRLPVKFRMFQKESMVLAKELQPAKFDRIDLSGASDHGISKMLKIWGPLLNKDNPNSAIITLSRNWKELLPASVEISSLSPNLLSRVVSLIGLDRANMLDMDDPINKFLIQDAVVKFGDHSEEFEKYMEKVEKKKPSYLNRRMEHAIVPHQVMFPIEAKPNTTIESLSGSDQYWVFNFTANPADRYSEWIIGEK